jgi:glycosyltransferase involved in cell wall biosynthesis
MSVDVSVLTPVLNEEEHIREAAATMLAQRFDGNVEIIFIDGPSEDGTREILRDLERSDPRVRVLENPRRSTPVSLNIGLAAAQGEFIARMDAHTLYPDDYLARGVERLRRGDVKHVSGPQLPRGSGKWSRRVAMALGTPLGRGGARHREETDAEIEVDSGFTGVWPRAVIDEQGGWNEEWHNDQDSELAARIGESGGRMVCLPQMAAEYIPRDSLRDLARQYWRYGYYRAKTSNAHPQSMRRSHVFAPTLALSLSAAMLPLGALRWVARGVVALWCAVVVGVALSESWRDSSAELAASPADIVALPAVFGAMHLAWGFGFLVGCLRFGAPLRAVGNLFRRRPA